MQYDDKVVYLPHSLCPAHFLCLFVGRITQKQFIQYIQNFVEGRDMTHGRTHYILEWIQINGPTQDVLYFNFKSFSLSGVSHCQESF